MPERYGRCVSEIVASRGPSFSRIELATVSARSQANLLGNVRTHTPEGCRVAIEVRERDGQAVFEVADRGPGMRARDAARIFDRFFRADPDRARRTGRLPARSPDWLPLSLVCWAVGTLTGKYLTVGIPAINAVVAAFALYAVAGLALRARHDAPRETPAPGAALPDRTA